MHVYDVFENILSETRRLPKVNQDIFCDLRDTDMDDRSRSYLEAASDAFRRLEQEVETLLDRMLPLDPDQKRLTVSRSDLDNIRRYFLFLRFRNSDQYTEIVERILAPTSILDTPQPRHSSWEFTNTMEAREPEPELENAATADATKGIPGEPLRYGAIAGSLRRRTFLAGVSHFLDRRHTQAAYLGNPALERYCGDLCGAEVSFGLATEGQEYICTDVGFGTLDEDFGHSM